MDWRTAVARTVNILREKGDIDENKATYLAQEIYDRVVGVAVEDERNTWITMAKAAPDSPDPTRGHDS